MNKYQTAFFDLDGTLVDSGEGVKTSFIYALNHFGIKAEKQDLDMVMGPPLVYSFMTYFGLDEAKAKEAQDKYREFYRREGIYMNTVYEGIPELLQELKDRGIKLATATSKPEHSALIVTNYHDLAKYFDAICGADFEGTRATKEQVLNYAIKMTGADVKKSVMIGDRKYDIIGGREFKLDTIGVLFGYGSRDELIKSGADYIAKDCSELLDIMTV